MTIEWDDMLVCLFARILGMIKFPPPETSLFISVFDLRSDAGHTLHPTSGFLNNPDSQSFSSS